MAVNVTNAIGAFNKAAGLGSAGLEPRDTPKGADFASMVKDAAEAAIEAGRKSEQVTVQAVAGNADLADVVTAVNNAEITLQTVVAVRDRVINAYQEIMRMPI